ncbi:MAG: hypothetical protein AB7S99_05385 [Pseudodonghicola sp.]
MTRQTLVSEAEQLEQKLAGACATRRLEIQPQLSLVLARLQGDGHRVPQRLRRLEAMLTQEAVEAQFDNMPV